MEDMTLRNERLARRLDGADRRLDKLEFEVDGLECELGVLKDTLFDAQRALKELTQFLLKIMTDAQEQEQEQAQAQN